MNGRKVYFRYSFGKVMAVEIYDETPEAFKARTGIDVTDPTVAELANLVDNDGVIEEVRVGKSVEKVHCSDAIGKLVIDSRLIVAEQDVEDMLEHTEVSLELKQQSDIPDMSDAVHELVSTTFYVDEHGCETSKPSFVGYIELPSYKYNVIQRFIPFYCSPIDLKNNEYLAVHLFKSSNFTFNKNNENPENGEWVVLVRGINDHSEGKRFKTEEEARDFIALGWKLGVGVGKDLFYYTE